VKHQAIRAIAAAAAMLLLCHEAALADAVRCSNEQKACVTACVKPNDPASTRVCITNCAQRQVVCRRTGCWDNGTRTYCGLLRQ